MPFRSGARRSTAGRSCASERDGDQHGLSAPTIPSPCALDDECRCRLDNAVSHCREPGEGARTDRPE